MAIFAVQLDKKDNNFEKFVEETNARLKDYNFVRSPFTGKIVQALYGGNPIYIVNMEPIYPNYTFYIWLIGAGLLWWRGLFWLHIPIVLLGSLGLFWSKYFFYFMLDKGSKKHGRESKLKLLSNKKVMEVIFFE